MNWTSRIVRNDGLASRIDWERKLVVFRKPKVLSEHDGMTFRVKQMKMDGIRVIAGKDLSGNLLVLTTRPTNLVAQHPNQPFWRALDRMLLNPGDWLDGELYVVGEPFEYIKTALANDEAVQLGAIGCSWHDKYELVQRLNTLPNQLSYVDATCEPYWSARHSDGVVYKDSHYGVWRKHKFQRTADCVVMAINPGEGKYAGQCGSLEVGMYSEKGLVSIAAVSGMDDATRARISAHDIGRVVEVVYERVASRGRLRHPRFLRWRDDKAPIDCKLEEI